ncbi:MAG: hypothetical protein IJH12_04155 [Clostridia bacterium]|nr:hypothetical protein [Clostridia bacterium]
MEIINKIANTIQQHGGRLYLVGGAVRDFIIGIEIHDEDYCVTGLSKEEFVNLFPECHLKGKSFEVFEMYGKEFALARTESKNGRGHKDFCIKTGKNITIEEDLKRRDFTINSIAKDILTGKIIDPFDGIKDINNKIIKATSEAFCEDPLRAYRAARFACKLNFDIDKNTIQLIEKIKPELVNLSAERVFDEFRKALSYDKPSIFFQTLRQANILDVHFIEISKLIGALQPEKYHPEGDAYNHTMLAVDRCAKNTPDVKIRFATLVHDLGKGVTPAEEYPHHINHDVNGVQEVTKFVNRLKMPNDWCAYGKVAAKEHMKAGIFNRMTPNKQVSFIERIYKTKIGLDGMECVVDSDRNCRGDVKDKIEFAKLGNRLMTEVSGDLVKKKFSIKEGIELKNKIHEQRVILLKKWLQAE